MKTRFLTKNLVKCFFAFIAFFFWIVCCPGIYRGYGIIFPGLLRWQILQKADKPLSRWSSPDSKRAHWEPIWFFSSSFFTWIGVIFSWILYENTKDVLLSVGLLCVFLLGVHLGHYFVYDVPAKSECNGSSARMSREELWFLWACSTIYTFFLYAIAWFLLPESSYKEINKLIVFLGVSLMIVCSNIGYDLWRLDPKRPGWHWGIWGIPPIALFMILVFLGVPLTSGPKTVVRLFKWGDIELTSLTVDKAGCSILGGYEGFKLPTNKFGDRCQLHNVKMLSRLGSAYYMEATLNHNNSLRFTIPAERVLSWSIVKDGKSTAKVTKQRDETASD